MAVPSLRSGDTPGGCGYGREVPGRRGSVEQPFRPGSLLMPFYPAVRPDVTPAGGADAVFELPGGAGIRQLPGRTGNLGLTPQSVNMLGGTRRVQGRGDAGDQLLADALAQIGRAWVMLPLSL